MEPAVPSGRVAIPATPVMSDRLQLLVAVYSGDLGAVQTLVGAGVDAHAENDICLHVASGEGHEAIVQFLISAGASVHAVNDGSIDAAASGGYLGVVRLLVSAGANIHALDDMCTRIAASRGRLEVVRFLVANGAVIYTRCMASAMSQLHYGVVVYLTSLGADICAMGIYSVRRVFRRVTDSSCQFKISYLILRGALYGYAPEGENDLRELKKLLAYAQADATPAAQVSRAARRAYFWWLPLCFALARRSGRRTARRNFRAFRRLGI